MRSSYYIVRFKNGKVVFAISLSEEEATVLSSAVMRRKGYESEIETITRTTDINDMKYANYAA